MSASAGELTIPARCKVNLGLAVMARRGDGFHQIETIMARLALADELTLSTSPPLTQATSSAAGVAGESRPGTRAAIDLETSYDDALQDYQPATGALPPAADNLAVRAARLYLDEWSKVSGEPAPALRLKLHKRVPIAAGLGGGSADAAAALRGLARLLPAGIDIVSLAAKLGSDVPFFAADLAAAMARGRGERLEPLELGGAWLLLAKPPLAVTAAEAYADLVGFTPRLRQQAIVEALAAGQQPPWKNALQPGVMRSYPVVRELLTTLRASGLQGCLMSGSGPTCFGLAASETEAEAVARELAERQPELWLRTTRLE